MRFTWTTRRDCATIYCSPTGSSTLPFRRTLLRRAPTLLGRSTFHLLIPIRNLRRAPSRRRRASHPQVSNKEHIMKRIIVSLVSVAFALLPLNTALAYSHANRYGGSTSHSYG